MEIILAQTAGFCFGVDRALKKVYDNLDVEKLYTYGPIIHNDQVVDDLEKRGVKTINNIRDFEHLEKGTVILRSHGAAKSEVDKLRELGFKMLMQPVRM